VLPIARTIVAINRVCRVMASESLLIVSWAHQGRRA
jgi:hypothetical protein